MALQSPGKDRLWAAGTSRLLALALLVVMGGFASAGVALAASGGRAEPAAPPAVRQLIVGTAASHSTTYATMRLYRGVGSTRVLITRPWPPRPGYHGTAFPCTKRRGARPPP